MAVRLPTSTRNALCATIRTLADAGANATLKFYTGAQPASANDAPSSTLLATITLGDPSFGAEANGAMALAGLPIEGTGSANGDAGWARLATSTGTTVLDGNCGAEGSNAQFEMNTITVSNGVAFEVVGGTLTFLAG